MKKYIVFFLTFMILSVFFNHPVEAVGVDTVLKVAAGSEGERVLYGISEKMGVKFATETARSKALQRWNYTLEDFYAKQDADYMARFSKFEDEVATAPRIPVDGLPGYSKVVLSAAAFLTGADLIWGAYSTFKDAYVTTKFVDGMDQGVKDGLFYTYLSGYGFTLEPMSDGGYVWFGSVDNPKWTTVQYGYGYDPTQPVIYYMSIARISDSMVYVYTHVLSTFIGDGRVHEQVSGSTYGVPKPSADTVTSVAIPVGDTDVPDVSKVSDMLAPVTDTPEVTSTVAIPSDFPDTVTVIIPDTGVDPVTDPVNDPLVDPVPDPFPDINTDPNGDPLPDPDPAPDPSGDPTNVPVDNGKCGQGVDTSKIKALGYNFTKTFPFSLPWDIFHAFNALFGGLSDGKPTWHFKFSTSLPVLGGNDFELTVPDYFDKWMPFVRGIILVSWNIGLIYAMRKWFGGAS